MVKITKITKTKGKKVPKSLKLTGKVKDPAPVKVRMPKKIKTLSNTDKVDPLQAKMAAQKAYDEINAMSSKNEPTSLNVGSLASTKSDSTSVTYTGDDGDTFTSNETNRIIGISAYLDINDSLSIGEFGMDAQRSCAEFADELVEASRESHVLSAVDDITEIVNLAKELDILEVAKPSGFGSRIFSFVKTQEERIAEFKETYDRIVDAFDRLAPSMYDVRQALLDKVFLMNEMAKDNREFFNELRIYIAAGEMKLREARDEIIPKMEADAKKSNDAFAVHEITDVRRATERLAKKLDDLKVTKLSALQTAPQLQLINDNNQMVSDKIQSTYNIVIPLWKKQFVTALSLIEQKLAAGAIKELSKATNKSIRDNADLMKLNAVELAQECSKGPVDIETLQYVQERLLDTIGSTLENENEQE